MSRQEKRLRHKKQLGWHFKIDLKVSSKEFKNKRITKHEVKYIVQWLLILIIKSNQTFRDVLLSHDNFRNDFTNSQV